MNELIYGILTYAARYWFVTLAVVIVYRACVISVREFRAVAKIRKRIGPDGAPGRLVLLTDPDDRYEEGYEFPLFAECSLGRSSANDIAIRQRSIKRRHARLELSREGNLSVRPEKNASVAIEGVRIDAEGFLREGERLSLGDMDFTLALAREDE